MIARIRPVVVVICSLATIIGLAACGARSAPVSEHPAITWDTCGDREFGGASCGKISVPSDWAHPSGPTVDLHLVRRPADDTAHRIGTLMLNDVAGGSSIEQLRYALSYGLAQSDLARRFDIVALDVRGVGHSDPLGCADTSDSHDDEHLFPADAEQFASLVAANRKRAQRCSTGHQELFSHLDMGSVARDVDAVRGALSEQQLSWYGIGYSTALGTQYARMFPGRIRAIVNDSAVDTTSGPVERLAAEITTAEESFDRFATWCGRQPTVGACALSGRDVAADFDRLTATADRSPIPAGVGRVVRGDDIRAAAQDYLNIREPQWPAFASALRSAMNGDATALTVPQDKTLNRVEARTHACADTAPAVHDLTGVQALTTMARRLSPHLGGVVAGWQHLVGCIGWPVPPVTGDQSLPRQAPPALFLASVHQSSSSYSWSFDTARQLPGSVVLSRDADDYSMFLFSNCARTAMSSYLVDLRLPAPGQVCRD